MRRPSVALAAFLAPAFLAAAQDQDTLAVILETSDGHQELRQQPSPPDACRSFLRNLARAKQVDLPVTLTVKAPPQVTGRVLEAWCILPSGKIMKSDGSVVEP